MNLDRQITRAVFVLVIALMASFFATGAFAASDQISWSLKYDPKTLDPAKVDDQSSETIRFLTGGTLLRLNRRTLQTEPGLASAWNVSGDGRTISFQLRPALKFSDGSSLTSADVVATLQRVIALGKDAPVSEEFVEPSKVTIDSAGPLQVRVQLPKRIVGVEKIFDEIAIEPANRVTEGKVTAGPFVIADYKRGEYIALRRNTNYWKKDSRGVQLPYVSAVRLDILTNREQDEMRFVRGQYQVIENVPADTFKALAQRAPQSLRDLGPSLNTEQMWFNQAPASPLPDFEKKWFQDRNFRAAVSLAIRRADLARIAYDGHATPADTFVSPANMVWRNTHIQPLQPDPNAALQSLARSGFRRDGTRLVDREGHPVRFSILTNAGNRARERMAAMIQQDLSALGMQVNVVTLDFPALIDRLMHSQNYEAAMLGLSNVEPDPSSMMNVWLSSSANHQWNPSQRTPSTLWEAEIDKLMMSQAAAPDFRARKAAIDRVQQIVLDELPFIYLVYPNALCAVSPTLNGVEYSVIQPSVVSSIETMHFKGQ